LNFAYIADIVLFSYDRKTMKLGFLHLNFFEKGYGCKVNCEVFELGKYNRIINCSFSPNGESVAFVAKIEKKEILVKDGKKSKAYDKILIFSYSPD